ncbi:MAG: hypothetical protein KDK51_08095, partial [Deltaproteobacteria bacterium]|nr:hypothetical protein [Deltaproteobacteria bacterium]
MKILDKQKKYQFLFLIMLCIILLSRVYFERARSMVPVTNNLEYKENSAAKILLQGGKMNLNRATYQELQALPA